MTHSEPKNIDEILIYLRKHGYSEAEKVLKLEAGLIPASSINFTDEISAKFDNKNDPECYLAEYRAFISYVDGVLDSHKAELSALLYPIFAHLFIELICNGHQGSSRKFFETFYSSQLPHCIEDVQSLGQIFHVEHITCSQWFNEFKNNAYSVRLSQDAHNSLRLFLDNNVIISNAVKNYVSLDIYDGLPRSSLAVICASGALLGECVNNATSTKATRLFLGLPKNFDANESIERSKDSQPVTGDNASNAQELSKKSKRQKQKEAKLKQRSDPNAPAVGRLPLPEPSEAILLGRREALRESSRRVKLGVDKLPSICFYTILNSNEGVCSCSITEDSALLACGFESSAVLVWSLTPNHLKPMRAPEDLEGIDREGDDILREMLDENQAAQSITFLGHSGPATCVSFSNDQQLLLSSGMDSTIRLWSLQTWSNIVVYRNSLWPVLTIDYGPLGFYFASGSSDRNALLWSTDRVQPLRVFTPHLSDVNVVKFHHNSNYLATGSADRITRVWDVTSGQCVRQFGGFKDAVTCLTWSPSGRQLIVGSADGYMHIFDVGQSKLLLSVPAHKPRQLTSVCFSREGSVLATGGLDCAVKLWDINKMNFDSDKSMSDEALTQHAPISKWYTKSSPVLLTHFTRRNLLLGFGVYEA